MKWIVPRCLAPLIFGCLALMTSPMQAADATEAFFRGNIALQEGRAAEALELYQSAAAGHTSAALEFNKGHAWLQLEQPARALLHWYRAALLQPQNPDIAHNIGFLIQQQQWQTFARPAWHQWFPPLTQSTYLGIATTCFLLALALLILPAILRKANVITRTLGWLLLVPAVFTATALWTQRPDPRLALVVGEKTTLRVAPTSASPGIKELVPGTHVRVLDMERNFRLVLTTDQKTGFLHEGELATVANW